MQVRARQLWGNEVYTQDSDLVAVLMHCGFYNHALSAPPASAAEVRAIVQPLPPQPAYHSCARNSIRSRAWGAAAEGCSYRVWISLLNTLSSVPSQRLMSSGRAVAAAWRLPQTGCPGAEPIIHPLSTSASCATQQRMLGCWLRRTRISFIVRGCISWRSGAGGEVHAGVKERGVHRPGAEP